MRAPKVFFRITLLTTLTFLTACDKKNLSLERNTSAINNITNTPQGTQAPSKKPSQDIGSGGIAQRSAGEKLVCESSPGLGIGDKHLGQLDGLPTYYPKLQVGSRVINPDWLRFPRVFNSTSTGAEVFAEAEVGKKRFLTKGSLVWGLDAFTLTAFDQIETPPAGIQSRWAYLENKSAIRLGYGGGLRSDSSLRSTHFDPHLGLVFFPSRSDGFFKYQTLSAQAGGKLLPLRTERFAHPVVDVSGNWFLVQELRNSTEKIERLGLVLLDVNSSEQRAIAPLSPKHDQWNPKINKMGGIFWWEFDGTTWFLQGQALTDRLASRTFFTTTQAPTNLVSMYQGLSHQVAFALEDTLYWFSVDLAAGTLLKTTKITRPNSKFTFSEIEFSMESLTFYFSRGGLGGFYSYDIFHKTWGEHASSTPAFRCQNFSLIHGLQNQLEPSLQDGVSP